MIKFAKIFPDLKIKIFIKQRDQLNFNIIRNEILILLGTMWGFVECLDQ